MRPRFSAIILFSLCLPTIVFGQLARLEGRVYEIVNTKEIPVVGVRVVSPGGQSQETDSTGHFIINFANFILPGQAARIEVIREGWLVRDPLFGECTTKNAARNVAVLKVIIVPKGSPLVLEPKQLSKVIARWADERVKLSGQVKELDRRLDEYAFLREYADKYGVTLDRFKAAADDWARLKESDDKEERALKEYWLKKYDSAALLAREAALGADEELEQANKERLEAGRKVIRRFRLEGNAFFELNKFREALAAYNEIEKRFSNRKLAKDDLAEEWAELKVLLGDTKLELGIRLEGAEGQSFLSEAAIEYKQAFSVHTRERLPEQWATTQNNLGNALSLQGERADGAEGVKLLNDAVQAYRESLKVKTREQSPEGWALTQSNLGNALRAQGVRAGGSDFVRLLGEAVQAFREALKVRTRERSPQDWAATQTNLGNALSAQGERAEGAEGVRLLDEAVVAYSEALTVRTREQSPQEWAMTLNNLGTALGAQGERANGEDGILLLKKSAQVYRESLKVRTREQLPQDWALTQLNLGNALRSQGERTEGAEGLRLLNEAIQIYREALKVRTREHLPRDWALTQNNLGIALSAQGERTDGPEGVRLLSEGVQAYREASKVRTREQAPQDWAITQNNLGIALKSQGERTVGASGMRLLNEAVQAFREALTVFTREQLPQYWAAAQNNLGKAFFLLKNWKDAAICFEYVLALYPRYREAYQSLTSIYHEQLFEYPKTFQLHQEWIARFPQERSVLPDYAEAHFTTGRFEECSEKIKPLLADPEMSAGVKAALQMIEAANLLALNQRAQIPAALDSLLKTIAGQKDDFQINWSFSGTIHFINQHEKLAADRPWLNAFFAAAQEKNRDSILKKLREAQASFKPGEQ
jgi:tetratricopeptide (TPR) repeat protein